MMLNEGILRFIELVALTGSEYRQLVEEAATHNQVGGQIYDLIHVRAVQKAGCDRLYTFNVKHFLALADQTIRDRVCAP